MCYNETTFTVGRSSFEYLEQGLLLLPVKCLPWTQIEGYFISVLNFD